MVPFVFLALCYSYKHKVYACYVQWLDSRFSSIKVKPLLLPQEDTFNNSKRDVRRWKIMKISVYTIITNIVMLFQFFVIHLDPFVSPHRPVTTRVRNTITLNSNSDDNTYEKQQSEKVVASLLLKNKKTPDEHKSATCLTESKTPDGKSRNNRMKILSFIGCIFL